MQWFQKLKVNLREIVREHPVSIAMFLAASIALGIYIDIHESNLITFIYILFYVLTPAIVLVETGTGLKKPAGTGKLLYIIYIIVSLIISLLQAYLYGFRNIEATLKSGSLNFLYTCLGRVLYVYLVFSILGSVFFMYRKTGLSFEEYSVRAFLGLMKASVLYGIVSFGVLCILGIFDTLIFEVEIIGFAEYIVLGMVGFPALLIGLSRISGEMIKFSRILMGYVFPGLLAAACLIVYVYILKIIFTLTIPSNEAFVIMTSIFAGGLFIWTCAQGCTEDPLHRYLLYYPVVFAPFIIVQIICLSMRIMQYGLTNSRYMGILLIAFEIVYVGYYAYCLLRGVGVKGALFPMLFAVVFIYFLVPGINVYSAITASQKGVIEKYLSEAATGENSQSAALARARSAFREIRDEGGLEGQAYIDKLSARYPQESVAVIKTGGDDTYGQEEQTMFVYAGNPELAVDISGYSHMKKIDQMLSSDYIDLKKTPICQNYKTSDPVCYADLTGLVDELEQIEKSGADTEKNMTEVLKKGVRLDDGAVLFIDNISFDFDENGVKNLTIGGMYLYN